MIEGLQTPAEQDTVQGIEITDAILSDARGLMEVRYKTWRSTYPRIYPGITEQDVDEKFADFEEAVKHIEEGIAKENPHKKFLVAKEEGNVVGFLIASQVTDEPREIKALYVLDEYQGKGIGKKLMKNGLEWLDAGNKPVTLEVVSANQRAIDFYKRFGFEKSRDLPMLSEVDAPDGLPIPSIEMVRKPASIK